VLILAGELLSHVFLAVIRVVWGWQFFQTGSGKLHHLGRITEYFSSLHIPMPRISAAMAGSTECFGGLLLVAGLGARLVSVPLTIVMLVAYATAEWPDIHKLDDFVKADPFPFLFTVLVVLCFGPGKISADYFLETLVFKGKKKR